MVIINFRPACILLMLLCFLNLGAMQGQQTSKSCATAHWSSLITLLASNSKAKTLAANYLVQRLGSMRHSQRGLLCQQLYRLLSAYVPIDWLMRQLFHQYMRLKQEKIKNAVSVHGPLDFYARKRLRDESALFFRHLISGLARKDVILKQGKHWLFLIEGPYGQLLPRVLTCHARREKGKMKKALECASRLVLQYKIHLMPRDQDMVATIAKLHAAIQKDAQLRRSIYCIKILRETAQKQFADLIKYNLNPAWFMPARIVIYARGKEHAQLVLNRVFALCKALPGCGFLPAFNEKVSDCLFFAQGNRDDKYVDLQEHHDDPLIPLYLATYYENDHRIYYSPMITGALQDYHLINPGH